LLGFSSRLLVFLFSFVLCLRGGSGGEGGWPSGEGGLEGGSKSKSKSKLGSGGWAAHWVEGGALCFFSEEGLNILNWLSWLYELPAF